jgi:FkbM family methyltransferase
MREIVILSSINWEYYWQRPQQLATQFAALGCKVIYAQGDWQQLTISRLPEAAEWAPLLGQAVRSTLREEQGVQICSPLMRATTGSGEPVDIATAWLAGLREAFGLQRPTFWVIGWQWGHYAHLLQEFGTVVYDCVDDLAGFSWATPELLEAERRLLAAATVTFGVSERLVAKLAPQTRRAYRLPNGVNPVQSAPFLAAPPARRWTAPVLGYVGALAEWVDTSLIAQVARAYPHGTVVIAGSADGADLAPLQALSNVVMLGHLPHTDLPALLAQFDVGLVPFRTDRPRLDGADSIKVYEYLAAGLPVVTTPYGDVAKLGPLVHLVRDEASFLAGVQSALGELRQEKLGQRLAFAKANAWRARAEEGLRLTAQAEAETKGLTAAAASQAAPANRTAESSPAGAPRSEGTGSKMHGLYIGNNRMLIQPTWGGKLLAPADDLSVMPDLLTAGVFELPLTRYLMKNLKSGMTVVDVGANIGYFSVLCGYLIGEQGRLIAYEANPTVFGFLMDNLAINGLHNRADVRQKAVYSETGDLTFYRTRRFMGNSSVYRPEQNYFDWFKTDEVEEITVQAEPLNNLVGVVDRIDFLKIDIEGGEYHAFRGMRDLLARKMVGTIAFEINSFRGSADWPAFATLLREVQAQTGKSFFGLTEEGELLPVPMEALLSQSYYPYALLA